MGYYTILIAAIGEDPPEPHRDEAGAKYLMRRVLHLFREPVAVL